MMLAGCQVSRPLTHSGDARRCAPTSSWKCCGRKTFNRFFYTTVGVEYHWVDRLGWKRADWMRYVGQPTHETWVLSEHGTLTGYCELEAARCRERGNRVPWSIAAMAGGKGTGAHLLSAATDRAWRFPARRAWVHTCTLDHPCTLQNYLDCGFRLFREERTLPPKPGIPSTAG